MSERTPTARRALCRLAYLLPFIVGVIFLIWACLPHLFFVKDGEAHQTLSLFRLMRNTWAECQSVLSGTTEATPAAAYFSYIMKAYLVVSWAAIAVFALNVTVSAFCSVSAFGKNPTAPEANDAKRWMKFFCFNRIWFAISLITPIVPTFFPVLLAYLYRKTFVYNITVHYFGLPAWLVVTLLSVALFTLFVATLRAQASQHLDMFRLYKAKK